MKSVKITWVGLLFISFLSLAACSQAIPPKTSPCDNFGQHCEPKVPINQWRAN